MNCEDMMNLPQLKNVLHLRAGKQGIHHYVRWIYFADCLQCVQDEYNVTDYIHGGEFVIITNTSMTDDVERLIAMVDVMQQLNIAALGINEGQISEEFVTYCEEKQLPLFELPKKYPLVDLSQIICRKLVNEKSLQNSLDDLFSSILNTEYFDKEKIVAKASMLGIDLNTKLAVVEVVCCDENNRRNEETAEIMKEFGETIRNMIETGLDMLLSEKVLFHLQTESILMVMPLENTGHREFEKTMQDIANRVRERFHVNMIAGVGNADYLENIKNSRKEAAFVVKIAGMSKEGKSVYWYQDQGIYTFISQIPDQHFLDDFVKTHIGKLIHADEINDGNLCETLDKYIQNNCNAKETAKDMFVHRNTLNYRLNKIREIIDVDMEDLNCILMLKLSFMIYKYRKE